MVINYVIGWILVKHIWGNILWYQLMSTPAFLLVHGPWWYDNNAAHIFILLVGLILIVVQYMTEKTILASQVQWYLWRKGIRYWVFMLFSWTTFNLYKIKMFLLVHITYLWILHIFWGSLIEILQHNIKNYY